MNVTWGSLSAQQLQTLSYIDGVTASLSLIGGGSIIACALCRCKTGSAEIQPIFHLSLADALASVSLLASVVLFSLDLHDSSRGLCSYVSALTGSLYLTTFLLTCLYSAEVYRRMRRRHITPLITGQQKLSAGPCGVAVYVTAWLCPFLLSVALVAASQPWSREFNEHAATCRSCLPLFHFAEDLCLLSEIQNISLHTAAKYLFIVPLCLSMIITGVFYGLAVKEFREHNVMTGVLGFRQYQDEKRVRRKAVLYQTVFIACWLPSLVLGVLSLTPAFSPSHLYWLYVLQALTAPLQGFLNCLVYGWRRDGFTAALYGDDNQTPLLNADTRADLANYSL